MLSLILITSALATDPGVLGDSLVIHVGENVLEMEYTSPDVERVVELVKHSGASWDVSLHIPGSTSVGAVWRVENAAVQAGLRHLVITRSEPNTGHDPIRVTVAGLHLQDLEHFDPGLLPVTVRVVALAGATALGVANVEQALLDLGARVIDIRR